MTGNPGYGFNFELGLNLANLIDVGSHFDQPKLGTRKILEKLRQLILYWSHHPPSVDWPIKIYLVASSHMLGTSNSMERFL